MQLTGTNRLIGLIALIANALRANRRFVAPLTPSEGQHDRDPLKPRTSRQTGVCADATNLRFAPTILQRSCPRQIPRRSSLSFAGLVAVARSLNPIPSRTRPLNSSAPMVLCLKTWESRSSPGLPRTISCQGQYPAKDRPSDLSHRNSPTGRRPPHHPPRIPSSSQPPGPAKAGHRKPFQRGTPPGTAPYDNTQHHDAGWSSPVARQAHNLKAAGSNPAPATNLFRPV